MDHISGDKYTSASLTVPLVQGLLNVEKKAPCGRLFSKEGFLCSECWCLFSVQKPRLFYS